MYIFLSALACVIPIALVFVQFGLDIPDSPASDMLLALLGIFLVSVLTYPAGVIGTVISCGATYSGLLTATEAVLFAAPFYVGAGYLQWYVLIPKYFRVRPNSALNVDAPPSGGAPVS